ncbi:hypothetical protein VIBRN418_08797 [Vibrio sp. N418]|nr:hypothetical protein VIBRN418_08797 [Vibrio sp. N418]
MYSGIKNTPIAFVSLDCKRLLFVRCGVCLKFVLFRFVLLVILAASVGFVVVG